ncbi:PilZ domain-containing protein [Desulfosarcina alkanivorans]|uniref:PilZ domain-containing protein n=1 Tax=Desulfosarcina alkanivorans TaxID=571177 RepID=UPI00142F1390|nr:PilZ domain-containing protein [Desulfosarcina alkanivorans]
MTVKEKRKFKRFNVPGGKVFLFNHFSAKVGWIKDLSEGGVSFEFLYKEGAVVDPEVIDLFSYEYDRYYLSGLPCRKIFEIDGEERKGGRKTRCCGLAFKTLNEHQRDQLDLLLNKYLVVN